MGINKPNVRFVVHFDIPRNIESYYQETDAQDAMVYLHKRCCFVDPADMAWLRRCLDEKPESEQKAIESHKLNAMGLLPKHKLVDV